MIDIFKGHTFEKVLETGNWDPAFDHYRCKLCNYSVAIADFSKIKAEIKHTYKNTFYAYAYDLKNRGWKPIKMNDIKEILSCNEVIIKNIIQ